MQYELRLNHNGYLNKSGNNIIYHRTKEVVQMGIGSVKDHSMYIIDFLSLYEGKGFAKASISFLFKKLPKIDCITLKCKDHILPFWQHLGGEITSSDPYYNTIIIPRSKINLVI